MPRVKLEISSLIDLEPPPPVVEAAIWHWQQYLRFLPWPGPRRGAISVQGDREHLNLTRALQKEMESNAPNIKKIAELRAALSDLERREGIAPDESQGYDWRTGDAMEYQHVISLPALRREIIRGVHIYHTPIEIMLDQLKIKEPRFHQELRSAYLSLAGKLCPSK